MGRDKFYINNYDDGYDAFYFFSAEEDGEDAWTYDQVQQIKYKEIMALNNDKRD